MTERPERLGDQIHDALLDAGFEYATEHRDGFEVLGHLAQPDRALVVFRAYGKLNGFPAAAINRRFLGYYQTDLIAAGFGVEPAERDGDVVALLVSRGNEVTS